jgi:hypothetical protein
MRSAHCITCTYIYITCSQDCDALVSGSSSIKQFPTETQELADLTLFQLQSDPNTMANAQPLTRAPVSCVLHCSVYMFSMLLYRNTSSARMCRIIARRLTATTTFRARHACYKRSLWCCHDCCYCCCNCCHYCCTPITVTDRGTAYTSNTAAAANTTAELLLL